MKVTFAGVRPHGFSVRALIVGACLSVFLNLDVAASLWVFHLLAKVQTGVANTVGFGLAGRNEYLTASSPATAHQSMGAILTLVVVVLWRARRHLRGVLRKALFGAEDEDDDEDDPERRATVPKIRGRTPAGRGA